ncbi:pullulanase [Hutsoniella sourekii]|uniref:pullulanase n=1 Tax=Hutsoniella sourekii TaxID=87650 RepID=UPI0004B08CDF|nr:pullulanase [Hutsoniella sourekii]
MLHPNTNQLIWRFKDQHYSYTGELGPVLHSNGTAFLRLWAPSAESVDVILYDKDDSQTALGQIPMNYSEKGTWHVDLNADNAFGIENLDGYYYHYEIQRGDEKVLALDPYAKSMAAWNSHDKSQKIGKAAIVDPGANGTVSDFANIPGYTDRQDAVIYELHVRDFTVDPQIADELTQPFGTFEAMIERLDYIQELGVTHIQLLPVLNYYHANELAKNERWLDYQSSWTNYNWGYDPHHYFALTGMYSKDPEDAGSRIREFKALVEAIHERGMGVILDVVYNHTAQTHILEDLEPNYYHFMNIDGSSRENFGGGRLGTTHYMTRRLMIDSLVYLLDEYKVDGFRFDMMGDLDAESIQMAYDELAGINPKVLLLGEGWSTYCGDELDPKVRPADQFWMQYTEDVGVFSDDIRNYLKSGFGDEGSPRFLTGGPQHIASIFKNLKAQPTNFIADQPKDVVQYIEAHDNLTLHDIIALSIGKDPKFYTPEIHQRIRLGALLLLTAQGTAFIHSGQEYGRTKQFRHPNFRQPAADPSQAPDSSTLMLTVNQEPFDYPYFIHDSYNSSDAINRFEWEKVRNKEQYPEETQTVAYTKGLIQLRRSSDAFRRETVGEVEESMILLDVPEIGEFDLAIIYSLEASNGDRFLVVYNGSDTERSFTLPYSLDDWQVIVDGQKAGVEPIQKPKNFQLADHQIKVDSLTGLVFKMEA